MVKSTSTRKSNISKEEWAIRERIRQAKTEVMLAEQKKNDKARKIRIATSIALGIGSLLLNRSLFTGGNAPVVPPAPAQNLQHDPFFFDEDFDVDIPVANPQGGD